MIEVGDELFVLRLAHGSAPDARTGASTEIEVSRAAAAAGVAPEVVDHLPQFDCLITSSPLDGGSERSRSATGCSPRSWGRSGRCTPVQRARRGAIGLPRRRGLQTCGDRRQSAPPRRRTRRHRSHAQDRGGDRARPVAGRHVPRGPREPASASTATTCGSWTTGGREPATPTRTSAASRPTSTCRTSGATRSCACTSDRSTRSTERVSTCSARHSLPGGDADPRPPNRRGLSRCRRCRGAARVGHRGRGVRSLLPLGPSRRRTLRSRRRASCRSSRRGRGGLGWIAGGRGRRMRCASSRSPRPRAYS